MNHKKIVEYYSKNENIWFIEGEIEAIYPETQLRKIFPVISKLTPDLIYITELEEIYIGEVKENNGINQILKAIKQVNKYGSVLKNRNIPHKKFIITKNDIFLFDKKDRYIVAPNHNIYK